MAVTDTPWCGLEGGGRLYLQSGKFTSTLLTSIAASSNGITFDGTNTYHCTTQDLFKTSGQFSSTVLDSEDVSAHETTLRDVSFDGNDTPYIGDGGNKMYLQSGGFTSTLKTSQSHPNSQPSGISSNTDQDTPNCGFYPDTLYIHSGQFTSTVKTNLSVSADPQGISWDGTDTLWARDGTTDFLYLQSGAFTSTVKDSLNVTAIETTTRGICTNDFAARTGVFLGNHPAEELPATFAMPAPTIDLISHIIVTPDALALGIQPEDTAHVNSNVARPWPIAMGINNPDPVVDFGQDIPASELTMSMNLFAPTINILTQTIVTPATLNITAAFVEGTATPDYSFMTQPLPMLTLNASILSGFTGTTSLPMLTLNANCVVGFLTYTTQTLPMLTLNIKMGLQSNMSLPMFTLVASGTSSNGGILTKLLPLLTLSAAGKSTNHLTFTKSLPMFTVDIAMTLEEIHTFASALPMIILNGQGISGSGAATLTDNLPLVTLSSSGYSDGNGTLTKALPMLVLDAFGTSHIARII